MAFSSLSSSLIILAPLSTSFWLVSCMSTILLPFIQLTSISPFGVWRNRTDDPIGSETAAGSSNYDGLYADVLKWQREGWIDYLMPQIYWRDDHPVAGFSTLAYWWNDFSYGRSLYVGLAPYRIGRDSNYKMWRRDKYLLRQIDLLRKLEGIDGFGYFSSKHFFKSDLSGLNRKLKKRIVLIRRWFLRCPG